jgi:hypothetical protein
MFKFAPLLNSCTSSAGFQAAPLFCACAGYGECLFYRPAGLRLQTSFIASGQQFAFWLRAQFGLVLHLSRSSSVWPNIAFNPDGFAAG